MARYGDSGPARANASTTRLHSQHAPAFNQKAGHFAVLYDVDSQGVGCACVSPCDRVVARRARTPLQQAAPNRKTYIGRIIQIREQAHHLAPIEELGVDTVQAHDVAAPGESVELARARRQYNLTTLREHDVEIECLRQTLP